MNTYPFAVFCPFGLFLFPFVVAEKKSPSHFIFFSWIDTLKFLKLRSFSGLVTVGVFFFSPSLCVLFPVLRPNPFLICPFFFLPSSFLAKEVEKGEETVSSPLCFSVSGRSLKRGKKGEVFRGFGGQVEVMVRKHGWQLPAHTFQVLQENEIKTLLWNSCSSFSLAI